MQRYIDMAGKTVGLWEVIGKDTEVPKRAYWLCRCIGCNSIASVSGTHLREGVKGGCRSCRGTTGAGKHPEEYKVWQNIKTRVFNPNRKDSKKYSALGMYAPWANDFMLFFHAIGERPSPEHSVDRIDNSRGYFPGNVRWATRKQQARNTSKNLRVDGKVLLDYAKEVGVPYNTLRDKFHKGKLQNALRQQTPPVR